MNHAISNPYFMEQVPKHRTPVEIQVNGRYGTCHRCGHVRVKVVSSFYLGKIPTNKVDEAGNKIYNPVSIRLCANCNSVIQSPVPENETKKKIAEEGKINPKVYALLALLIHGERSGAVLGRKLEVSQPTLWTYVRELKRSGLVEIGMKGRNAKLSLVDVTDAGLHHFDIARSKV